MLLKNHEPEKNATPSTKESFLPVLNTISFFFWIKKFPNLVWLRVFAWEWIVAGTSLMIVDLFIYFDKCKLSFINKAQALILN